jgi:hypothetical protein
MGISYLHPALPASEASAAGTSMFDVIRTMSLASTRSRRRLLCRSVRWEHGVRYIVVFSVEAA